MNKISTKILNTSLSILLFLIFSTLANGQVVTVKQYEKKARQSLTDGNLNQALEYFSIILNDEPKRSDLFWETAETALKSRRYNIAAKYYEALSKTELAKNNPTLSFQWATALKTLGEYDKAQTLFADFAEKNPTNVLAPQAKSAIEACSWAKALGEQRPYEAQALNSFVNSGYVEAAPTRVGEQLFYTTTAMTKTGKLVTQIYGADALTTKQGMPLRINSEVEGEHTAHYALNTTGTRLFYTIGKQAENGEFTWEIFMREKNADDSWQAPVKLQNKVNVENSSNSQPNIGFDNTKQTDRLFFSSNRAGGKGGFDLYAIDLDKNGLPTGEAAPISDLNTAQDDITPFFSSDSQQLFFSSEGYKSMGGFDVYRATLSNLNWSVAQHIGSGINSSFDDTYFSFSEGTSYVVSNKKGGLCASADHDCTCNDIYSAPIKVRLEAETFLARTADKLKGCRLDLYDLATGELVTSTLNGDGNDFKFPLELGKKYRIIASRSGFSSDSVEFNTKGLYESVVISKQLSLIPEPKIKVLVLDRISLKPLNGAWVELRDAAGKTLQSETLTSNVFSYSLAEFGKSYSFNGRKLGFDTDTTSFALQALNSENFRAEWVDTIYLTPFAGLPLRLYFHNDNPTPNNRSSYTTATYGETFTSYYNLQGEYMQFANSSSLQSSNSSSLEIAQFFDSKLKFGMDKLNEFSRIMEAYLAQGDGIELMVEGYASPLALEDYNRTLTSRRVSSVINHFYRYGGGILRPYLLNGQFRINVLPFGEDRVKTVVSDQASDRRNSVYSLGAMNERRVEISDISRFEFSQNGSSSLTSNTYLNAAFSPEIRLEMEAARMRSLSASSVSSTSSGTIISNSSTTIGSGSFGNFDGSGFIGLPISLYFDNDRPSSGGSTTISSVSYDRAYSDFYAKKSLFTKSYSRLNNLPSGSDNEMISFFDTDLKQGYLNLVENAKRIETLLKQGYNIEVALEGYASPLANTQYNQQLTERRVSSLVKFFSVYNKAALARYIKTGQLKVTLEPLGERTNEGINDQSGNAASIYSIEASRARRVVVK
jgi:outer membrane protein OmpA-like peptidoglycan-associated protein/tetratricopeptide (TPR) repeat protein